MRKRILTLLLLSLIVAIPTIALAQEAIEGELVDTRCFAAMGLRGEGHKQCAIACAKDGIPVGVVDKKGKMWTLLHNAVFLAQFQGQEVRVTGQINKDSSSITLKKFEVKKGARWEAVELPKTPPERKM